MPNTSFASFFCLNVMLDVAWTEEGNRLLPFCSTVIAKDMDRLCKESAV